jgi:hypothetical protein
MVKPTESELNLLIDDKKVDLYGAKATIFTGAVGAVIMSIIAAGLYTNTKKDAVPNQLELFTIAVCCLVGFMSSIGGVKGMKNYCKIKRELSKLKKEKRLHYGR